MSRSSRTANLLELTLNVKNALWGSIYKGKVVNACQDGCCLRGYRLERTRSCMSGYPSPAAREEAEAVATEMEAGAAPPSATTPGALGAERASKMSRRWGSRSWGLAKSAARHQRARASPPGSAAPDVISVLMPDTDHSRRVAQDR